MISEDNRIFYNLVIYRLKNVSNPAFNAAGHCVFFRVNTVFCVKYIDPHIFILGAKNKTTKYDGKNFNNL